MNSVNLNVKSKNLSLLVDSGASLYAIKLRSLHSNTVIIKEILEIKGIDGTLFFKVYVILKVGVSNTILEEKKIGV